MALDKNKKKRLLCYIFFIICFCMTGLIIYITGDLRYDNELKVKYGSWDIASYNTPFDFYKDMKLDEEHEIGRIIPIGYTNGIGIIGGMDDNIPSLTSFQLIEGNYPSTTNEILLVQEYDGQDNPIYKVGDNFNTKITRTAYGTYDFMNAVKLWNDNNQEDSDLTQEDTDLTQKDTSFSLTDAVRSFTFHNIKREHMIDNNKYQGTLAEEYVLHIPTDITVTDEIVDTYGQLSSITWSVVVNLKIAGIIEPYETHMKNGTKVLSQGFVTMDMMEELKDFYIQQENEILKNDMWVEHIFINTKQEDSKTYNRIIDYLEDYQEKFNDYMYGITEEKKVSDEDIWNFYDSISTNMKYQGFLDQINVVENTYIIDKNEIYSINYLAILIGILSIIFCTFTMLNRTIMKKIKVSLIAVISSSMLGLISSLFISIFYLNKTGITISQLEIGLYIKIMIAAVCIMAMILGIFYKQLEKRNECITEEGTLIGILDNLIDNAEVNHEISKDAKSSDIDTFSKSFQHSSEKNIEDKFNEKTLDDEKNTDSNAYLEQLRKAYGRVSIVSAGETVNYEEQNRETVEGISQVGSEDTYNNDDIEITHNMDFVPDVEATYNSESVYNTESSYDSDDLNIKAEWNNNVHGQSEVLDKVPIRKSRKIKIKYGYLAHGIMICTVICLSLALITLQKYNLTRNGNDSNFNYRLETLGMPDTNRKYAEKGISEIEGVESVHSYRYGNNLVLMSEAISKDPMFENEMKEVEELSKRDDLVGIYRKKDQIIYNKNDRYVSTSLFSINSDDTLFQEIRDSITVDELKMEQYEAGEMAFLLVPMRNKDNSFKTFHEQYKDILSMESEVGVGDRILISRYDMYGDVVLLNAKVNVTIGGIIYYYSESNIFSEYDNLDYAIIGSSELYNQLYTVNIASSLSSSSYIPEESYDRILYSGAVKDSIGETIYYVNSKSNVSNHMVETALMRFADENYYTMEVMNSRSKLEQVALKGRMLSITLALICICITWIISLYDYHKNQSDYENRNKHENSTNLDNRSIHENRSSHMNSSKHENRINHERRNHSFMINFISKKKYKISILSFIAILLGHMIGLIGYGALLFYHASIKYQLETPLTLVQKMSVAHNYMEHHYPYILHIVLVTSMFLLGYYILYGKRKERGTKQLDTQFVLQDSVHSTISNTKVINDTWSYKSENLQGKYDVHEYVHEKDLDDNEDYSRITESISKEEYERRLYEAFARKSE